jgi:NAD(P)-dependent dehydrogenase (short-subunit alcohol dehydrogenase family)
VTRRFSGKVVLITGASRPEGIGAAAAQRFADEGASTADEVAALVVESAVDGRRERTIPVTTGVLARLAAAAPALRRAMVPSMERRGRAAKEAFRARHRR